MVCLFFCHVCHFTVFFEMLNPYSKAPMKQRSVCKAGKIILAWFYGHLGQVVWLRSVMEFLVSGWCFVLFGITHQ